MPGPSLNAADHERRDHQSSFSNFIPLLSAAYLMSSIDHGLRQVMSTVLAALRLAEVVRYESDGKRNRYRLKHPSEVRSVLSALSRFVNAASAVRR